MEKIFVTIEQLGENKSLVPRLRFMAKGLHELRGHRWLPRILTKKADEASSNSANSTPNSAPDSIGSNNSTPSIEVSPAKQREKENGVKEMSMEDAQLFSAMENFVQKLNVCLFNSIL